jgi:predicted RNA-binding Zn-ribbon protein involved in translation (DUF1610 family)
MQDNARKTKTCQEESCAEQWSNLSPELKDECTVFVYCPFCANEMITRCSACGEPINDVGYKFCPWCGVGFE